jgi:hypothetical protein
MPAFDFGGTEAAATTLPVELQKELDASVRRFEEQCGAMLVFARMNGWLEKYRAEVTAMVEKGYHAGRNEKQF